MYQMAQMSINKCKVFNSVGNLIPTLLQTHSIYLFSSIYHPYFKAESGARMSRAGTWLCLLTSHTNRAVGIEHKIILNKFIQSSLLYVFNWTLTLTSPVFKGLKLVKIICWINIHGIRFTAAHNDKAETTKEEDSVDFCQTLDVNRSSSFRRWEIKTKRIK